MLGIAAATDQRTNPLRGRVDLGGQRNGGFRKASPRVIISSRTTLRLAIAGDETITPHAVLR